MSALMELASRVESATGADRELDALIEVAIGAWPNTFEAEQSGTDEDEWSVVEREPGGRKVDRFRPERFTASLDAALTLLLPAQRLRGFGEGKSGRWAADIACRDTRRGLAIGQGATPALALTAAALRARASMEGAGR